MANSRIVVPCTTDAGTSVDTSRLNGDKHLITTGDFTGLLTILASHDGMFFLPIASVDPNDATTRHQVIEGTYVSLSATLASGEKPYIELLSLGESGQNYFGVIAVFLPDAASSKVVHIDQLFNTTLNEDMSLICQGPFTDTIQVEQSADGIEWSPLGSFNADNRRLLLCEDDNIAQLRLTPTGAISDLVTVTIGSRSADEEVSGDPVAFYESASLHQADDGSIPFVNEKVLCEWLVDFDKLAQNLELYFRGTIKSVPHGGLAKFEVRIGSQVSGSFENSMLIGTITTTSCCESVVWLAGTQFLNPGGQCYVQVVGSIDDPYHVSFIRDVVVGIG
jgi:hypothetical protein